MEKYVLELIDPPSSAAPTKQWQDFLAMLDSDQMKGSRHREMLKQQANEELARRAKAKKQWWLPDESPKEAQAAE
jgi:hypothetical protein